MGRSANFEIINMLRQDILAGKFDHSAFLPSERLLAEEFGVGRGIIRGAFRVLLNEGLLCTIPGRGVRVKLQRKERRFKRIILRVSTPLAAYAYESAGILAGVCDGASRLFAEVLLSAPPAPLVLNELIERYSSGDIQGIIFLEQSGGLSIESVVEAGIPCVVANLEDNRVLPCVRMDYRGIGFQAGKTLIKAGFRRLAVYQGAPERFIYQEMLAGFKAALADAEISLPPSMIVADHDDGDTEKLRQLLDRTAARRPEGFFCMRDRRAAVLCELCEKLHLRIPEEVALISYDNISWPGAEERGLTTIAEEVRQIGRNAVDMLNQWYNTGSAPDSVILPGVLIERRSHKRIVPYTVFGMRIN